LPKTFALDIQALNFPTSLCRDAVLAELLADIPEVEA
jgi:hypothetical protein